MTNKTKNFNSKEGENTMKKLKANYDRIENKTFAITIAESIVEEVNSQSYDEFDLHQFVWDNLEAIMIYDEDRWNLMKLYQSPEEASYNDAFIECYSEICSIIEEDDETEEENETNNNKKVEDEDMYKSNEVFNEENNMEEEVIEMNESNAINLDEALEELEDFADSTVFYTKMAMVGKVYEDEDAIDAFSQVVEDTYYQVEDYMIELKNLRTCIYVCLQIAEAPEDVFSDYLDRLKAIKNNLIKSKEMLAFMADKMEVELNV